MTQNFKCCCCGFWLAGWLLSTAEMCSHLFCKIVLLIQQVVLAVSNVCAQESDVRLEVGRLLRGQPLVGFCGRGFVMFVFWLGSLLSDL